MANCEFIEVEEVSAIVVRRSCSTDELATVIPAMFSLISQANPEAEMVGAPMIKYYEWNPPNCTIEAACPVEPGTSAAPGTELRTYPACTAIYAEHIGPYVGLWDAWAEIWNFVAENGILADKPWWDTYVTDPSLEPDASKWLTELYVPIKKL